MKNRSLPTVVNATSIGFTLELEFGTFEAAIGLVALVPAVIGAVADSDTWCAVAIAALENSWSTLARRTLPSFVRTVFTIFFSVASSCLDKITSN